MILDGPYSFFVVFTRSVVNGVVVDRSAKKLDVAPLRVFRKIGRDFAVVDSLN